MGFNNLIVAASTHAMPLCVRAGSFRFAAPPPLNMLPAPGMSANFNGGAVVEVQLSPVNAPASPAPSGQLLQRGGLGGRSVGGGSYAG